MDDGRGLLRPMVARFYLTQEEPGSLRRVVEDALERSAGVHKLGGVCEGAA